MLADTWYLFLKYMRISMRMPLWSLFTLIQPLIWLLIFGNLFAGIAGLSGFPTDSYIDFLIPGIIIMTVLFGSSWSGVSLLREITAGSIDKMLVAPISRVSIVFSRVLHSSVQVVVQSLIMVAVSFFIGSTINIDPLSLLLAMLIILLLGIGFAALSNGFAITLQREEPLVVIGNLMTLPLMFFSSALMPEAYMPGWIKMITQVNPVHYAVEAVRAVMIGDLNLQIYLTGFGVMLVFALITLAWAVSSFNSSRE